MVWFFMVSCMSFDVQNIVFDEYEPWGMIWVCLNRDLMVKESSFGSNSKPCRGRDVLCCGMLEFLGFWVAYCDKALSLPRQGACWKAYRGRGIYVVAVWGSVWEKIGFWAEMFLSWYMLSRDICMWT